jgi:RimJ/RimL family protein N-acetyltransferase
METIMETERFYFVRMNEKYVDFYVENMNNPEIYQYISNSPRIYTREDEMEWIKANKDTDQFTVIDKVTNKPIGTAGFHEIKNETGEIGIWITPTAQDKHYGQEIIKRIIDYGYNVMNVKRITLKVHENNPRAVHVYEKIGFYKNGRPKKITDGIGNPTRSIHMTYKKERRN